MSAGGLSPAKSSHSQPPQRTFVPVGQSTSTENPPMFGSAWTLTVTSIGFGSWVMPASPCGPCGPCGPCAPCGPCGPCGPVWLQSRLVSLDLQAPPAAGSITLRSPPSFLKQPWITPPASGIVAHATPAASTSANATASTAAATARPLSLLRTLSSPPRQLLLVDADGEGHEHDAAIAPDTDLPLIAEDGNRGQVALHADVCGGWDLEPPSHDPRTIGAAGGSLALCRPGTGRYSEGRHYLVRRHAGRSLQPLATLRPLRSLGSLRPLGAGLVPVETRLA